MPVKDYEYEANTMRYMMERGSINFVYCGSCSGYHHENFRGDCRERGERIASWVLDKLFGPTGWTDLSGHEEDE